MSEINRPAAADRNASERTGPPATTPAEQSFARRALIGVGIAVAVSALALFLWYSMYVLLLAFAAVLVGVLLRGGAEWVAQKFNIAPGWGLGIVLLALVGFFVLLGLFAAPSIVQQGENLADQLPRSLRRAEDKLRGYSWGRRILSDPTPDPAGGQPQGGSSQGHAPQPESQPASQSSSQPASQPASETSSSQPSTQPTLVSKVVEAGTSGGVVKRATRLANSILSGLLALLVVVVTGIYLAASPRMYVTGLVMLAPHARRERYRQVLGRLAQTLRWWMVAQLIPMAAIGVLTMIGLKLIGIELWLILGLLAALLNFIPNFGPLISGTPAFLLALAQSPTKAMWVVVLYIVVQSLEGYILTPLVQRRAVQLPPALLILFQVLAGLLLGALGVVLAAPLLGVIVVAVKMLYVEDVLGDKAHVPGENGDAADPGG